MVSDRYVSLHTHSEHSQLDGFSQVDSIARRAASLGQSAVALTDHQECSGHIELEKSCKKVGIKPIFGMEGYLVDNIQQTIAEKSRLNSHLCLFAENQEGLKNLWSVSSLAYLKGMYYRALTDWEMLAEHNKGLIATDGCMLANMARFIIEEKEDQALLWASKYLDVFGENNFFMELHTWQFINPKTDDQKQLNENMHKVNLGKIEIANRLGVPLIVVNDAHYSEEEDWEHHALFWTLRTKSNDSDRLENGKTAAWIMSSDEVKYWMSMHGVSASITEQAIANTAWIADRCNVEIERKLHVPVLTKSKEEDLSLFLNTIEKGFQEKVVEKDLDVPLYMERTEKECGLIIQRELPGYFNIVSDYCQEFKNRGWLLAAGRGSAGGSLITYLMNINELDAVARGLLFERFLNPGRLDYPDIDSDIPKSKRQEAIGYLEGKYGAEKVCRIGTFGRLGAKQVLNDLCRVMEIPFADHKAMTKIIEQVEKIEDEDAPEEVDEDAAVRTWEEILETQESDLNPWVKKYPLLFFRMQNMIGLIRQSGTHASGVIISDESLIGLIPLRKKKDQPMTTQFDMYTLADLGFIKFDLLGVKTLDILMETQILVQGRSNPRFFYDFNDEQYADPQVWEPIGRGETVGVFQVNTPAGTQLAKKIKPQNEYEMATLISVDRPGVTRAGMTDEFIERRKGLRDIVTPHPFMTEILSDTYGIVVYQEQVLSIVQRLAGYSLEEADMIRAILGKKKMDKMREEKPRFIQHCLDNAEFVRLAQGRAAQKAAQCWDQIEQTGSYAFNKCLTGDTMVTKGSTTGSFPSEISLKELYEIWTTTKASQPRYQSACKYRQQGLQILARVGDRIKPQTMIGIFYQGMQSVWEIHLADGKSIKATAHHRHLTETGWKTVQEINMTDRLATMGDYEQFCSTRNPHQTLPSIHNGRTLLKRKTISELPDFCESCKETEGRLEIAHLDNDPQNWIRENVKKLCNSCHKKQDYKTGSRKKKWSKGRSIIWQTVTSIEYAGEQETYDVEMEEGTDHSFVANGIVTHNSHALGYSLLACWGSWLARYYPLEFLIANLVHRPEKLSTFVREIKRKGFEVLPPDINHSGDRFTLVNGTVRYGLQDLKNVGPAALKEIKEHRPFTSLPNFLALVDGRACKKQVVENLIKIGAFDSFGQRYHLMREYYDTRKKDKTPNIIPDFQDPAVIQQIELEIVGSYITEDPLDKYRDTIDGRCLDDPDKIDTLNDGEVVEIGGVLARLHEHQAKNGLMAFLDVEWDGQEFSVVCFPESYRDNKSLLQVGSPVIIRAIRGKRGVFLHNVIRLDYVTN